MSDLRDVSALYQKAASFLSHREAEPLPRRFARKLLVELNPLLPRAWRNEWGAELRRRVRARSRKLFEDRLRVRMSELQARGGVHTFMERERPVRMALPQAQDDFVQRRVLMEDRFFERHFLERTRAYLSSGSTIVDVGANIGNHCLYWAMLPQVSCVRAFEPVPPTFSTLVRNIQLNAFEDKIEARNVAVGSTTGDLQIFVPNGNPCLSRLDNDFSVNLEEAPPDVETFSVGATTLDLACADLKRLDLLKIDVEGFEEDVLRGSRELIGRLRPALMVEVWPAQRAGLEKELFALGYRIDQNLDENNAIYVAAGA